MVDVRLMQVNSHVFDTIIGSDSSVDNDRNEKFTYTWVEGDGTFSEDNTKLTIDAGEFYIVLYKGVSTSNIVNSYAQCRIYQGAILEIIAKNDKKIRSVSFIDVGTKNPDAIDLSVDANADKIKYTKSGKEWIIETNISLESISFGVVQQMRFIEISITFDE